MVKRKKRIAVLVRDGSSEALRMALGLTVLDNEVSVYIMDEPLEPTETLSMSLQGLKDMGAKIFTNLESSDFETMNTGDIARALTEFDTVIPY